MKTIGDRTRYVLLRELIAEALEDELVAGGFDVDEWTGYAAIMISPALDAVQVYLNGEVNDVDFPDWHVEYACDFSSALDLADLYFDLRR